jgi:hypothetical protein
MFASTRNLGSAAVRAGVQDAGTNENGECVLQVFGDGGEAVRAFAVWSLAASGSKMISG